MHRAASRLLCAAATLLVVFAGCRAVWRPAASFPPAGDTLATADYYSRLGNWDKAWPIYVRLERMYRESGDKRSQLYAHVSRFGSEAESSNLQDLSNELRDTLL